MNKVLTYSNRLFFLAKKRDWNSLKIIALKYFFSLRTYALLPLGFLIAFLIRMMRPFILIRIENLLSERIGHFAGNTELYLCERDAQINVPQHRYIDFWFCNWPISNYQLAKMWKRVLHIWPSWLLAPTQQAMTMLPFGKEHQIEKYKGADRDIYNLLDQMPPHLVFSEEEERRGENELRKMGIPYGAKFICLNVRDNSYLERTFPWKSWSYHSHRDCDVKNYVLTAQQLVERGYYVIRMGVVVNKKFPLNHPRIIDYANNGMRSDFMDIYLGAKCFFCISNSTGFDSVPIIFRRPIAYVNVVPFGDVNTCGADFLMISKKYFLVKENRLMKMTEIFETNASDFTHSTSFAEKGIQAVENTPQEIHDLVMEMEARLINQFQDTKESVSLQNRFWEKYKELSKNSAFKHGKFAAKIGTNFLETNQTWLQ